MKMFNNTSGKLCVLNVRFEKVIIILLCIGGLSVDRWARRGSISSPNSGRYNDRRPCHIPHDDRRCQGEGDCTVVRACVYLIHDYIFFCIVFYVTFSSGFFFIFTFNTHYNNRIRV